MKATSIEVGKVYRLVDSNRVKVIERLPKSRYDHYQNFEVEYLDRDRRIGTESSREFFREWGPEDDEGRRKEEEAQKDRQARREEAEATENELQKAGYAASVRIGLDRYTITLLDRESFDKFLEMLMGAPVDG